MAFDFLPPPLCSLISFPGQPKNCLISYLMPHRALSIPKKLIRQKNIVVFQAFFSRVLRQATLHPALGPSVGRTPFHFFGVFELMPKYLSDHLYHCPCPSARDRDSRVFGLVSLISKFLGGGGEKNSTLYTPVFFYLKIPSFSNTLVVGGGNENARIYTPFTYNATSGKPSYPDYGIQTIV